jgi:O-antigen/teichoic acid export membrane protein
MSETAKKLFSNTLIVFIGTGVASVFSYLFNMLMGRLLGPEQYGEMAAVLSVLTIVSVAGSAISIIVMRYSGELYHGEKFDALNRLIAIFLRFALFLGLILFLLGLILSKPISAFFHIDHLVPVIIGFSSFVFGLLIVVNRGVLQGTQRFSELTIANVIEMIVRLLLGLILVKIGFELNGAMLATVIATITAFLITMGPINDIRQKKQAKSASGANFRFDKKEMLSYALPTIAVTLFLTAFINIDIILVKHYFPAEVAGQYSAVATVGKIILYIAAPIITVMFPMISEKKAKGEKHFKIFLASLAFTAGIASLILAVYSVMPYFIVNLLYGESYAKMANFLPSLGVFVLLYAMVNLIANYFMAIKNFIFLYFFVGAIIVQIILIGINHDSIIEVIKILIATQGLLFALMFGYYLLTKKQQIVEIFKGNYGEES